MEFLISRILLVALIPASSLSKDIGEYYEDGKDNLDLLLSNKIDLIEFSIDSLINKEDTGDKRIIFSEFKKLIRSLSPLDQDFAFDILSVKINTPKDLLVKELKHKKSSPTYGESSSSQNESNKHIEAFQDIFISNLIKNEFEDVSEFEDLLNSSEELFNIVKKLQSGQNKDISSNFINISFTEKLQCVCCFHFGLKSSLRMLGLIFYVSAP